MAEFENQSNRAKEQRALAPAEPENEGPNIESVISGSATVRKPSGMKRFRRSFIAGDASTVGEHVFWNLVMPGLQDILSELGRTTIDMMIYGERRPHMMQNGTHIGQMNQTSGNSRVNYVGMSNGPRVVLQSPSLNAPQQIAPQQSQFAPNEIVLGTRAEAELVISKLLDILNQYGQVTVANLYSLVNVSSQSPLDFKFGWKDLSSADTQRVGGGYWIKLPPSQDLGN